MDLGYLEDSGASISAPNDVPTMEAANVMVCLGVQDSGFMTRQFGTEGLWFLVALMSALLPFWAIRQRRRVTSEAAAKEGLRFGTERGGLSISGIHSMGSIWHRTGFQGGISVQLEFESIRMP